MGVLFETARSIRVQERDVALELDQATWPVEMTAPETWTADPESGLLHRIVEEKTPKELATPLKESILRFPSAPIHGLHRLSQEQVNMGPVESFHSYRLLSHPRRRAKVTRIFLMHNGLNETRRMGLYYQLASYLIKQDKGTVCLLRPFPGHLTRSAFPGLTETPLDHYLWDGLHLFRQFLRYMIETRWLLSTIVRHSYYHCVSGSGLLRQSKELEGSRLEPDSLAAAMAAEWEGLRGASQDAIDRQGHRFPKMPEQAPPDLAFEQSITSLRTALRLDAYDESNGRTFPPRSEPELHALGYSLGGFTAQSVFMSWPFLVSSCSTLLSGGAMRELAPTAFADPEEWQTVLHSLRYELDEAMMDHRFAQSQGDRAGGKRKKKRGEEENLVAGMDPYLFLFLKRTFYEVFQQEYRGSFQTRLVSFRQRMLFVVGGDDPIVRPQSVLDSGPPDGINMVAVGGLGHFLGDSPQGKVEEEQRSFWLPEIGRTIGCLARSAAKKHRSDLARTWLNEDDQRPEEDEKRQERRKAKMKKDGALDVAERLALERDGTLPNRFFQRSLDDLLVRAADEESNGILFILKNEAPTFLLDERALQEHAAALYHEDVGIVDYIDEVRTRRSVIEDARKRICVVLPWNAKRIMLGIDAGLQHPSQSESSGEMAKVHDVEKTWRALQDRCTTWTQAPYKDAIRVFAGQNGVDLLEDSRADVSALSAAARRTLGIDDPDVPVRPALPDCWAWMSNDFLSSSARGEAPEIELSRQLLCNTVPGYLGRENERKLADRLKEDDLRMVTVSRARFNPRFRGRIIAEPRQAQELLLRVALCIVGSLPFGDFDFEG